jgi:hypothetical protein
MSILDLFDDAEEKHEVDQLIAWWNRYAFSGTTLIYITWLTALLTQPDFSKLFVRPACCLQR